jgi:hypothetical protein
MPDHPHDSRRRRRQRVTPTEAGGAPSELTLRVLRHTWRQHRILPAPRRYALTWRGFLAAHASTIVATDFLSVDSVSAEANRPADPTEDDLAGNPETPPASHSAV